MRRVASSIVRKSKLATLAMDWLAMEEGVMSLIDAAWTISGISCCAEADRALRRHSASGPSIRRSEGCYCFITSTIGGGQL